MMSDTATLKKEILPKQRMIVTVLLIATGVLPFLGLAPFVFLILFLFFIRRSFRKHDKNQSREKNAIHAYVSALYSLSTRTFVGIISITLLLLHQASKKAVSTEVLELDLSWIFVGFGVVALIHFLSLFRISYGLYRHNFEVDGSYGGLFCSMWRQVQKLPSRFFKKTT